jgi:dolichol-phosphate mannosyltransferase
MELFLVLALAAVFFFSRLHTPLLEPEEGRYAEIPRQMLAEGSWLVPILHGQPYLDKPPLLYWLVMASYSLFGVHDWAARLVPGVAGLLTIAVSYFWARRTAGNRAAILGSGMLCLSAEFLYYGRMLTMNGLLALFVTATLAFTHFALQATGKRKQLAWIALAGLACGFGLLTKGPVILAVVVPPLLLLPRLDQRLHRPGFAGWSLFAGATFLIAAPWYLAVCFRDPEFAGYFFWRHNITRFVQPFDHAGPVWEYLPGLLFGMMPWTLLIFPMFRALFQHSGEAAKRRPAALGMFLLAFLWMFVFFSLAGSKRPGYIVPVLPPLALALGCYLDSILDKRGGIGVAGAISALRSRMAYAATVIMLAAGIGLAVLSRRIGGSSQGAAWMLAIACGLSLVVALYHIRKARFPWLTPTLITAIVLFAGIQNLLPQYARRFSVRHAIEMQQHRITSPEMRVICYPHGFDSASFYLERGDVSSFARDRRAVMVARLEENPKALLMVQTRHLPEFLAKLPPTLEFIPLQKEEMITIGEVRRREEVPHFWLAERSPSAKQR